MFFWALTRRMYFFYSSFFGFLSRREDGARTKTLLNKVQQLRLDLIAYIFCLRFEDPRPEPFRILWPLGQFEPGVFSFFFFFPFLVSFSELCIFLVVWGPASIYSSEHLLILVLFGEVDGISSFSSQVMKVSSLRIYVFDIAADCNMHTSYPLKYFLFI